ncbi:MAG TPA: N-acetyltransferase [Roseiflexaceae bacterium]|nr:N-acetyltransferase [Roseiflexaceae bacterium]
MTHVRAATDADFPQIWAIFAEVIAAGDTYPHDETFTAEEARRMWLGPAFRTFVAVDDRAEVVGVSKLGPNFPGRGAHVANAAYIVAAHRRGTGIGRLLVEHSLAAARATGYRAIQFNFVVSTNRAAVQLYERLGFTILATLPGAFNHRALGYVDAYVMHRML